jgi:NAD(P)H-dependent flavin oxidoreductase YrpB (nitropropane dioxygenase family)
MFLKYIKNLKIPIIQAPMAGRINKPKMVSEVINYGGIGSFGKILK